MFAHILHSLCTHIRIYTVPTKVRKELARLKKSGNASSSGTKRQDYWVDSAIECGLVDSNGGVRFVPPVVEGEMEKEDESTPNANNDMDVDIDDMEEKMSKMDVDMEEEKDDGARPNVVSPFDSISSTTNLEELINLTASCPLNLVSIEDRKLVPDYIFLALGQLVPCNITQDDKIGVYRDRAIGFQGLCCRHVSCIFIYL